MDRTTFVRHLEAALENLYDRAALESNALARRLSRAETTLPPERLHRVLVEAIHELRPAAGSPPSSPIWRRHRYLERRYLGGRSHKETAGELALSLRQAHRVRSDALDEVADRLWRHYVDPSGSLREADAAGTRPAESPAVALSRKHATLEDELARLDAEPAGGPIDVSKEMRAVVEVIAPLARQRAVTIRLDLAGDGLLAAVDRAVLRQTVLLLAIAALERQHDGRIFLATSAAADEVLIDVVFVPADPAAVDGLAQRDPRLTAARHLIDAQAGALDVLAVDDRACFRLSLPPPKVDTVLTIDDNPDLARLFDAYLQGTRYHVIRAKTGPSALRLAEKHRPDVITLDVMMPFQDGWEIFRQLRDNPVTTAIPIVVCSILPEMDLALALGAADFLAKPVTRESLIATLDRCLYSGSGAS